MGGGRKSGLRRIAPGPRVLRTASTVDKWDVRLTNGLAVLPIPSSMDRVLPILTRLADHSKLWIGTGALLVATGQPKLRRAGMRGLGSVAVASLIANQAGKRLFVRKRPVIAVLPKRRMARRIPTSNSFPSGHSASAAAFAIGAALEAPPLIVPLGLLAAGVGVSRVFTAVHYPSDVVAGAAIGATVALVGAKVVPARTPEPERCCGEPAVPQPSRNRGEGVVIVVNPGSGSDDCDDLVGRLRDELPDAEVHVVGDGEDIGELLRSAAARADVLGVVGGDGTVNAAAEAAMTADRPLLVIPGGTFDHFAKDLGLTDVDTAVRALREGHAVRVDVGEAAGRLFLNTASLGSYPEFVRVREQYEDRLGKPAAAALAVLKVWRRHEPLVAEVDGTPRQLLLLFVGNGVYQPRGFVPRYRARLDTGRLDLRLADSGKHGLWALLGAAITSDLYRSKRYVEQTPDEVTVRVSGDAGGSNGSAVSGDSGMLATDGEVQPAPQEVTFRVRRQALTVFCGRHSAN